MDSIIKENKHILCNVIVIDDFYENPLDVREYILQKRSEFVNHKYHPGIRTASYATQKYEEYFNKLVEPFSGKIEMFNCCNLEDNSNGSFQLNVSTDKTWIHCDSKGTNWAGIIYLTPNAPITGGTGFYKYKGNGQCYDGYDNTIWELINSTGNVFNRLVLFRSNQYHKSLDYFGNDFDDGRLIQLFFFKTEK